MNRANLSIFSLLVFLILLQVFIFNQLHLFGSINPMIYLYFLIYHRLDANQTQFILLAFALGFTLDLLLQGAGGHTLSSITIATLRPQIFSLSFGSVLQETTKNLNQMLFYRQFYFSLWIVFLHHLIYFLVLFFSFSTFFIVLKQTLLTGIFTLTFLTVKQLFIGKKNGT
jgi:rod shape-determining protein MreD